MLTFDLHNFFSKFVDIFGINIVTTCEQFLFISRVKKPSLMWSIRNKCKLKIEDRFCALTLLYRKLTADENPNVHDYNFPYDFRISRGQPNF